MKIADLMVLYEMSFRIESNFGVQNNLNELKLKELCGTQVPENELKVLCNGRLTCLICSYRPIFDTLNMLLIHRKGKKHIAEYDLYLKRKEELNLEKIRKKQIADGRKRSGSDFKIEDISKKARFQRRPVLELKLIPKNNNPSNLPSVLTTAAKKLPEGSSSSLVQSLSKGHSSLLNRKRSKKIKSSHHNSLSTNSKDSSETGLIMSGWLKDSFGNWVKDPNAEFDSDD